MSDTKENMEKRVVSLASSGVIGYYIFSKLNAAQDTVEMPDDGLNLPPALKEATFYEGGIVSVESVKRMSEIIAEQARVYAATIRNGIRTPIVVEDEQPAEEENMFEEEPFVEEEPFAENDTEIFDDVEDNVAENMFDEDPVMDDIVMDDITPDDEPIFDEAPVEEVMEEEEPEEDIFGDVEPESEENNEEFAEEFAEEIAEPAAEPETQPVYIPVMVDSVPEGANVSAPMTFADMGGFEGFGGMAMPVEPNFTEGGLQMPVAPMDTTMPEVTFEEPAAVEEMPVEEEQPVLMENVEPLHKVDETEEEDPSVKEQFKSIADFLNTL